MFRHLHCVFYAFVFISVVIGSGFTGYSGFAGGQQAIAAAKAADKTADKKLKPLTEVQTLLFDTPHMVNISPGKTVRYSFSRKSQLGDGFEDHIDLVVSAGETDKVRNVAFDFFQGERRLPYPALSYVTANPLLTIYFNKDAWALARRIKAKGVANYLRNRILDGLAGVKSTKPTKCIYEGQEIEGEMIVFAPFAKDENRHHLVHYSGIEYQIVLSNDIPGGVCEIRSSVPFPSEKAPAHFINEMKKSGMLSLAGETEKVNQLTTNTDSLIIEVMRFDGVAETKGAR